MKLKLRYGNLVRSNFSQPHVKSVFVPDVHRLLFSASFGLKFQLEEKNLDVDNSKSSPIFNLKTCQRLADVFSSTSLVKCHKSGDITIIARWSFVCQQSPSLPSYITEGALVLPIKYEKDEVICFVPCDGLDPETNNILSWVESIPISSLMPFKITDHSNLKVKGMGKETFFSGTDYTSIPSGQVAIGDLIMFRGKVTNEVMSFADDAFAPEGTRDSVRFKNRFCSNSRKQHFHIFKEPHLQGRILKIPKDLLVEKANNSKTIYSKSDILVFSER